MSDWKRSVATAANAIEKRFDRLKFDLKLRTRRLDPVEILPYRGYGTRRALFLKGRVLERKGITRSSTRDTIWQNLRNMTKRFMSDEVPGARVRALFGESALETVADEEGFFEVRFDLPEPLEGRPAWHPVDLELIWSEARDQDEAHATGEALVAPEARFGVISDLDDTVVKSSATDLLKMVRIVLINNAYTRLPFEGVAEFYQALQRGGTGTEFNPVFYVSSSPWNLYDLFVDFLDVHGVPAGPLFLKDWGPATVGRHREHKLSIIRRLFDAYPDLPFVLIGDSGQHDPEIYHQAVREYPGRVRAIYVREVEIEETEERTAEVRAIARKLGEMGVEMVHAQDTAAAARHALENNLIARGG